MASAKNGTQKTAENESVTLTKNSVAKQESVYTIDEFCRNAQVLFGTMSECVRAALKEKGIKECKKLEAEKIVKQFMKKEVE
ncbi:MAG: hypothetical protein HFG37_04495 [Eubacterium sp.]|nr:hypothetical protein [Eubacterium sp.]MCI9412357.1 hypothetical protein [Eubacterium sp.]